MTAISQQLRPPHQLPAGRSLGVGWSMVDCQLLRQHFAYATGRLGVLETQLLQQTDIDRLLGASNGKDAVKMLRDIEFLVIGEPETGNGEFPGILDASTRKLKADVETMAPDHKRFIFDILWLDFDRPCLAYGLKKRHGFTSGLAEPPVPPVSAGFAPTLEQSFVSPREIDELTAGAVDAEKVRLAKMSKSYAIYMYVIHTMNIHHTHSLHRSGETKADVETVVLQQQAVELLRESLDDMRRMVLGPEPLFSYAARALNHISLLKVLLTGKVNNLPIQEIKSLLPPLL